MLLQNTIVLRLPLTRAFPEGENGRIRYRIEMQGIALALIRWDFPPSAKTRSILPVCGPFGKAVEFG